MSDEKRISEMETFFLALADKTRLRLLNLLREGEVCVCFLVQVLKESQPKISRHLAYLRNAGIVAARRDGKWMHYKISEPKDEFTAQVLGNILIWLDSQEKMQAEYKILTATCCLPNNISIITRNSRSNTFAKTHINHKQITELETFLL